MTHFYEGKLINAFFFQWFKSPAPRHPLKEPCAVLVVFLSVQKCTSYSISKDIPLHHIRYDAHSVKTETFVAAVSYGGIFRFHVKLSNVFSTLLFPWPSGLAADQYWARVQRNRFFSTVSSFAALAPFHRAASLMIKGSMPPLSGLWGPSWKRGCGNLEEQLQYVPFTHSFQQNDMWQNVICWNKYIHSQNGKQRCQKVQVKACHFSDCCFWVLMPHESQVT